MFDLPETIPLDTMRDACTVLGLPFDRLARVSLMPDAVAVDHTVDTEVGPVLTTTRIAVTR